MGETHPASLSSLEQARKSRHELHGALRIGRTKSALGSVIFSKWSIATETTPTAFSYPEAVMPHLS